jgi:hypothetical protein
VNGEHQIDEIVVEAFTVGTSRCYDAEVRRERRKRVDVVSIKVLSVPMGGIKVSAIG